LAGKQHQQKNRYSAGNYGTGGKQVLGGNSTRRVNRYSAGNRKFWRENMYRQETGTGYQQKK
jgi:hypothetical protein